MLENMFLWGMATGFVLCAECKIIHAVNVVKNQVTTGLEPTTFGPSVLRYWIIETQYMYTY